METKLSGNRPGKNNHATLPIYDLGSRGEGAMIVERALANVPGVVWVYVNAATEMVYVQYDASLTDPDRLTATIALAGFGPATQAVPVERAPARPVDSIPTPRRAPAGGWFAALRRALRLR